MRIHRHRQRKPKIQIPEFKVNDEIDAPKLRVIDNEGQMLGVLPFEEALRLAEERELDLVEVSPKADPPVAKILDFGSFKYQKEKEIKKQRAAQKEVEIKGIRLSLRIADGDKQVRLSSAKKFLEQGNKVRIELILRGREKAHGDLATQIIKDFIAAIHAQIPVKVEQQPKRQGGKISGIIVKE